MESRTDKPLRRAVMGKSSSMPESRIQEVAEITVFDADQSVRIRLDQNEETNGLFTLYKPPAGESCTVDIVAVHGLGGHWAKTWTDVNGTLWLKDILPSQIPYARIMSYGYNGSMNLFGKPQPRLSLREVANDLLNRLNGDREMEDELQRPIVFICHNTGGLIVKQLVISTTFRASPYSNLFQYFHGIAFFGTPHRGPVTSNYASVISRFMSPSLRVGINKNALLDSLAKDSEIANETNEQFLDVSGELVLVSFYETVPLLDTLVVDKGSAYLGLPNERLIAINANHRDMCRFSNENTQKYRPVGKEIKRLVESALASSLSLSRQTRKSRQSSASSHNRRQVQSVLAPSSTSDLRPPTTFLHGRTSPKRSNFLFDALAEYTDVETASISADEWFETLEQEVHRAVEDRAKDEDIPVKVAIIDTGIDGKHPRIDQSRIEECKSFIDGQRGDEDVCGHGTHAADLILRVAPRAILYVARVLISGQGGELNRNKGLIAKAIDHAVDIWEVDIISMSWGSRVEIPEIKRPIRNAFHKGVIMFAAASNSGASLHHPIAFPASLRQVICINSTDGYGNPSDFNPPPTADRTLSIIGESVEAAWPTTLSEKETQRRSGTSVATPIAAGIAALILEYSRQWGKKGWMVEDPDRLRHCDEMRKVFHYMAQNLYDYHCVVPGRIFDEAGELKHVRISSKICGILDSLT